MVYEITMLDKVLEDGTQLYWIDRKTSIYDDLFGCYPELELRPRTLTECFILLLDISTRYGAVSIKYEGYSSTYAALSKIENNNPKNNDKRE